MEEAVVFIKEMEIIWAPMGKTMEHPYPDSGGDYRHDTGWSIAR